jgi:RNA polymerase sigma-70 factor (ECF subfamily)
MIAMFQAVQESTTEIRSPTLDNSAQLDSFLQPVQNRGFRIAQLATGNQEDALDLVQEAMFKLVEKYASRPEQEWTPLFYRILSSRINDFHRRNTVRNRHRSWLRKEEDCDEDPIQTAPDPFGKGPDDESEIDESMVKLQQALMNLPPRQQQAFLLRAWEGLDVKQTATAMACAEGSVKTHYSRAVHTLRIELGEHWT